VPNATARQRLGMIFFRVPDIDVLATEETQIMRTFTGSFWAEVFYNRCRTALLFSSLCVLCGYSTFGAAPQLEVSGNGRWLQYTDGKPFFYLGDTAWELFHRLNREEADRYLANRAVKGFTVIQAVALAEQDGLNIPNAYGHTPLIDLDPTKPDAKEGPNNDYWDHVDYIVDKAEEHGMFVGLLPSWGDKWQSIRGGIGPKIFDAENARIYGEWLGNR